jgi:hypothetical protein
MRKIILFGALAIGAAILADAFASDPDIAQSVSPYAAVAPSYQPTTREGRAAYVDPTPVSAIKAAATVPANNR